MPVVNFDEWRSFVAAHPEFHLLQTAEWGRLKSGFGWKPVRVIRDGMGAQILFRSLPLGLTLAYIPKMQVSHAEIWDEIDTLCRKEHAIFSKIEFDAWDRSPLPWSETGLVKRSPQNIQPPRTILIDLRGGEDEILARMKQKTRYNIRLAGKKGVSVRTWDDLTGFHGMMLTTGGRDAFGVHSLEYYEQVYELFHAAGMAELLVAEYEGRPLAALMVFARGKRAWYVYGASNDEERNRMPAYLLQWQAMRWARARGCEEYDLWGVPDEEEAALEAGFESSQDGLWGVYRFKRGFGGELKRAVQAVDRIYNPLLYRVYELLVSRR